MSDQALSETELATHIEGLAGCEARRDVAERLAADAYADGARTIADLGARWPEDGAFFADYAAAAEGAEMDAQEEVADAEMDAQEQEATRIQEMLAGQTLPAPGAILYWRASGGQSDLYGGEYAADTDQDAEAESFRLELLAQCATDAERASIAAGRIEWVAS